MIRKAMFRLFFTWFCKWVVPQLKFMREGNFKLERGPTFKWLGDKVKMPCTEAIYINKNGSRARIRVEILDGEDTAQPW